MVKGHCFPDQKPEVRGTKDLRTATTITTMVMTTTSKILASTTATTAIPSAKRKMKHLFAGSENRKLGHFVVSMALICLCLCFLITVSLYLCFLSFVSRTDKSKNLPKTFLRASESRTRRSKLSPFNSFTPEQKCKISFLVDVRVSLLDLVSLLGVFRQ